MYVGPIFVSHTVVNQDLFAANLVSKLRNLHTQTPRRQYGPIIGKYRNQIANSGVWRLLDSEVGGDVVLALFTLCMHTGCVASSAR